MATLFKLLSLLPLWLAHSVGWVAGWLVFVFSSVYRQRFVANARQAGLSWPQWRGAVGESGKMVAELPRIWWGRPVRVQWAGAEHVQAALARGGGALFLTPHLGCFEITARAYASRFGQTDHPMTVLFRPPRQPWLRALVGDVRERSGLHSAPTTLAGVKQLLKALKQGGVVGMLPDQVPPLGLGVWAPFFGHSAYTMTLSARLAQQTGTTLLMIWGERLSWGRGYRVQVEPFPGELPADALEAATSINRAMETMIRLRPQQYLWGYNRYKQPRKEM